MRYGLKAAIIAGAFRPAPGHSARTAEGGIGDYLPGSLFQDCSAVRGDAVMKELTQTSGFTSVDTRRIRWL